MLVGSNGSKAPNVVGLTYRQAQQKGYQAKLEIQVNPRQDKSNIKDLDSHKVVEQYPLAGAQCKDKTLTVTLEGVPDNKVPSLNSSSANTAPSSTAGSTPSTTPSPALVSPIEGKPIYPFAKDASIACGRWPAGSTDYPYFGAPRENGRLHGAIDIYPPGGRGTKVKAIKDGTVVQVVPDFYTRADGEVCCGILINHGDFVAFYGEMTSPPPLSVGQAVKQSEVIGTVSGTVQLHFEEYTASTTARENWYGSQPANLLDPTDMMLKLTQ